MSHVPILYALAASIRQVKPELADKSGIPKAVFPKCPGLASCLTYHYFESKKEEVPGIFGHLPGGVLDPQTVFCLEDELIPWALMMLMRQNLTRTSKHVSSHLHGNDLKL